MWKLCVLLCVYLSERFAEFSQNALLVKHLALVSVLIIVMDFLSEVCRQLVEGHILLHLFVLRGSGTDRDDVMLTQFILCNDFKTICETLCINPQ